MKSLGMFLFICIICLLNAPVALAQNGAAVVRGLDVLGGWWTDDAGLFVLAATDAEIFCADEFYEPILTLNWMMVIRPGGSIKYQDRGAFFTRVFYPATWADFGDTGCDLWNNSGLMVAEGIVNSIYNDNDLDPDFHHPKRRNVWGYSFSGTLEDYSGVCDSDMVSLNIVERWMLKKDFPACEPDCLFKYFMKGPRVECAQ